MDFSGVSGVLDSLPSWIEAIKSFDYLWLIMLLMPYVLFVCFCWLLYAYFRWNRERE